MFAVGLAQEACVRELLRAHANVELRNDQGQTALEVAEEDTDAKGSVAIAELLRQHIAASAPPTASEDVATARDAAPAVVARESEAPATGSAVLAVSSAEPECLSRDVLQAAAAGDMKRVREWLRTGDINAKAVPKRADGFHIASACWTRRWCTGTWSWPRSCCNSAQTSTGGIAWAAPR